MEYLRIAIQTSVSHFKKRTEFEENGSEVGVRVVGTVTVLVDGRVETLEQLLVDVQQNGDVAEDAHDQLFTDNSLLPHRLHEDVHNRPARYQQAQHLLQVSHITLLRLYDFLTNVSSLLKRAVHRSQEG